MTDETTRVPVSSESNPGAPPPPERPEWLPEKFENPEALAQAYKALEQKMGGAPPAPSEPPPAPAAPPESPLTLKAPAESQPPAEVQPVTQDTLAQYAQEYASTGQLSETSRAALDSQFGKEFIDQYLQGVNASQELHVSKVLNAAGGQDTYERVRSWAVNALPEAEVEALNNILDSLDTNAAVAAVAGLKARYNAAMGMPPEVTYSGAPDNTGGVVAYRNTEEWLADMAKPEYQTDESFRQKVMDRLRISNI